MARLNPLTVFPYICHDEIGSLDFTTFNLKSLAVNQYRECEELLSSPGNSGRYGLKIIQAGLVGWDNFTYSDGEVIPFNFFNLSAIPYTYQLELINEIISISEVDDDLVNEIRTVVKWSNWFKDAKSKDQWDCDFCMSRKFENARNCDGMKTFKCHNCNKLTNLEICERCQIPTKINFKFRFSNKVNDFITRCPLSVLTPRSIKAVNFINYIDSSKSLPFSGGAAEQTNYFFMLRNIVLSEQNSILSEELDEIRNTNKATSHRGKSHGSR